MKLRRYVVEFHNLDWEVIPEFGTKKFFLRSRATKFIINFNSQNDPTPYGSLTARLVE